MTTTKEGDDVRLRGRRYTVGFRTIGFRTIKAAELFSRFGEDELKSFLPRLLFIKIKGKLVSFG
jgi:hypothetical protein